MKGTNFMIYETHNLFYISNFNSIGGVETYLYEIAKKYHDLDILVVYRTGDSKQVSRLKKYVNVVRHINGNHYKTNKIFCNYETDLLDYVEAKKKIQIVHAMFKTQGITPRIDPRIDEYFAVSKSAAKEWEELTGKKVKVNKNPITILEEEKKPVLLLISATRLTPEKRKRQNENNG